MKQQMYRYKIGSAIKVKQPTIQSGKTMEDANLSMAAGSNPMEHAHTDFLRG